MYIMRFILLHDVHNVNKKNLQFLRMNFIRQGRNFGYGMGDLRWRIFPSLPLLDFSS